MGEVEMGVPAGPGTGPVGDDLDALPGIPALDPPADPGELGEECGEVPAGQIRGRRDAGGGDDGEPPVFVPVHSSKTPPGPG